MMQKNILPGQSGGQGEADNTMPPMKGAPIEPFRLMVSSVEAVSSDDGPSGKSGLGNRSPKNEAVQAMLEENGEKVLDALKKAGLFSRSPAKELIFGAFIEPFYANALIEPEYRQMANRKMLDICGKSPNWVRRHVAGQLWSAMNHHVNTLKRDKRLEAYAEGKLTRIAVDDTKKLLSELGYNGRLRRGFEWMRRNMLIEYD